MTSRVLLPTILLAACGGAARPETTVPAPPSTAPVTTAAATPAATTAPVAAPAGPVAAPVKVRTVEGITEYRLANGLTVLLFPDPSQSNVTIDVTYTVGSRNEGYGETGMAHLLEHMMFKGSPHIPNPAKVLEARGGQNNASTWYDRTNYFETLPASQENLDFALDLEADRMLNAKIAAEDLKSEFSVVRNEFERDEDDPSAILDERVQEAAYLWHNYGHPTIGSRADIERVPVPALQAFYRKYYQPDNAVLCVAGKFDEAATLAAIGKTFGILPKPSRVLPQAYTIEPAQDGERRVTLARNGDVSVVEVGFHTVNGASPDFTGVEAAADVMTREPSGRLYKKLVETKLAAAVGGGIQALHDPGLVTFTAEVRDPKNVDKVEKIMLEEIDALASAKVDDKEIQRYQVATEKQLDLAMTNSQRLALELSEYIAIGDWRSLFAYKAAVARVTAADVQRVAKTYFVPSNRTVGRFVPTKDAKRAPLTEGASIADYVKDVKEGGGIEQGEAFDATLDNIDRRTQRGKIAGGISTALLPKKTRGGKVSLTLKLHWGDARTLQNKAPAADLLGALMARGTTAKTYQEIQDLEDQLKARITLDAEPDGLTLQIDTLRDKLAPALDLATEILTKPAFPPAQLELVRQEALASLEQERQDPQNVAFTMFENVTAPWPKADPRYHPTTDERIAEVKKLTVGEISSFYRSIAGTGHGELVVIGDFDPAAISGQIAKLASWTSRAPYARLDEKVFGVPGGEKSIDLKDKENVTLVFGHDLQLRDTDPDYPALLVANEILGSGEGSRLWTRVREHEGLSYGVGSWVSAGALDDVGAFGGYAIVAPANLAKAKASILDEVKKLATEGTVTEEELAHAKATWLKDQDTNLGQDRFVAQLLANLLYRDRTMDFNRKLRAAVGAVTVADVARVAKTRIQPARLVVIDAGDHAKAAVAK